MLLGATNITKQYRYFDNFLFSSRATLKALDNVSLSVKKGCCLGIVGESGSGKTTLAKIITGIVEPDSGVVSFKGKPITDKTIYREYRKNVQMVFQDPYLSLNPRLRIASAFSDIIKEHITKDKREIRKILLNAMNEVGLSEEHLERYPHQFSGGQCQRLSIARCLVLDPEIIVADEPVSALDVSLSAQVLNLLKKLKKEGKTIILIAHDLAIVKFLCDEILVIKKGIVQEYGAASDIFSSPISSYTKELITSSMLKETSLRSNYQKTLSGA